MKRRVLLVSPYFPPHETIGSKRAINFVQAIRESDHWEVVVLASRPFSGECNPSLNATIPSEVPVYHAFVAPWRPFIRLLASNLLKKSQSSAPSTQSRRSTNRSFTPFDQYLWDVPAAIHHGKKLIKRYQPDLIWVNADPWSGFLAAYHLNRITGVPWVADLRDPWTIFEWRMLTRPRLVRRIISYYERRFFTTATRVVFNSETASQAYQGAYPERISKKFTFIRNAFNPSLLPAPEPTINHPFIFGYFGGFRPVVPSAPLLKGFAGFVQDSGLLPDHVRFVVSGKVDPDFWHLAEELEIKPYIEMGKGVPFVDALSLLRSWDVLLIVAINDYRWMIPAKFYDYLFARKPILAASDNHELNSMILQTKSGKSAPSTDLQAIAGLFSSYYQEGKTGLLSNENDILPYGQKNQNARFLEVMEQCVTNSI